MAGEKKMEVSKVEDVEDNSIAMEVLEDVVMLSFLGGHR